MFINELEKLQQLNVSNLSEHCLCKKLFQFKLAKLCQISFCSLTLLELDEIPSPVPPHTNGAEIDPKFFSHLDDSVQKIIQKEKIQEEYQKVGYIEVFKGNTCHVLKILDNLHVIVIIPDRHIMYLLKK